MTKPIPGSPEFEQRPESHQTMRLPLDHPSIRDSLKAALEKNPNETIIVLNPEAPLEEQIIVTAFKGSQANSSAG
jgi:hypothetical protein